MGITANSVTQTSDATACKTRGAYYTDDEVASFLVTWAVRSEKAVVMDPSFGGGVFLRAACRRIAALGGVPARRVKGVELDAREYGRTLAELHTEFGMDKSALRCCDFFELEPASVLADAVVGNPPFIRYHRFNGAVRKRALERSASQGVGLTELVSSWAPFLVHAISMVRPGGRLAMVIPFEMTHAAYARPVLQFLARSFAKAAFLTFREKIFTRLSENTLLLLAEGRGNGPCQFTWRDFSSVQDLFAPCVFSVSGDGMSRVDDDAFCSGEERLIEYFLPPGVRRLYQELRESPAIRRLGDLANIGVGYVTGANGFFHLHPDEAQMRNIPSRFLRPAVLRGRALKGTRFTEEDWRAGLDSGDTGSLLHIGPDDDLPKGLLDYVTSGEQCGVSATFKCRTRSPWYSVPNVYSPDAFLTYMTGVTCRLAVNAANAVAPNNLHIVRVRPTSSLKAQDIVALWHNSLTQLSTEVEGHALGGGMLKMEPQEARNILLPLVDRHGLADLAAELDDTCRTRGYEAAEEIVNEQVLKQRLGLSAKDCKLLQMGRNILLARRYKNGKHESRSVSAH